MNIKFKYNQKEHVYYIYRGFLGGQNSVIGNGIIEKLIYDSGWVYTSKHPNIVKNLKKTLTYPMYDDGVPRYCIRIGGAHWVTVPEPEVFKIYKEARRFIKENKIPFYPDTKIFRMKDSKLLWNNVTGKWE